MTKQQERILYIFVLLVLTSIVVSMKVNFDNYQARLISDKDVLISDTNFKVLQKCKHNEPSIEFCFMLAASLEDKPGLANTYLKE